MLFQHGLAAILVFTAIYIIQKDHPAGFPLGMQAGLGRNADGQGMQAAGQKVLSAFGVGLPAGVMVWFVISGLVWLIVLWAPEWQPAGFALPKEASRAVAAGALFFTGIHEELFFRGFLQCRMAEWGLPPAAAIGASALLFGLAHAIYGPAAVLLAAAGGAGFGWLSYRQKNVLAAGIAHGTYNALVIVL